MVPGLRRVQSARLNESRYGRNGVNAMHINDLGNFMTRFMKGLDTQQPDWFIRFADPQSLADCVRSCTDGLSGTVRAKELLRNETAKRLALVLQAGVIAGLVEPTLTP